MSPKLKRQVVRFCDLCRDPAICVTTVHDPKEPLEGKDSYLCEYHAGKLTFYSKKIFKAQVRR